MREIKNRDGLNLKLKALNETLQSKLADGLVVAFSGGVDSAFLLWAAERERQRSGGRLLALTTTSASFSAAERHDAEKFISSQSIDHVWCESQELSNPQYAVNDLSRCFHCKSELFDICRRVAVEKELGWVAYGYNASDVSDFRPGHQAAIDNGILSPLADSGLVKDEIRFLLKNAGIEMHDKPASPCLSSRLMTGVPITPRKLRDVEVLEAILRDGGLKVFRIGLHEEGPTRFLRLEIAAEEMEAALQMRQSLVAEAIARGYKWVTLDLGGYKAGGANLSLR